MIANFSAKINVRFFSKSKRFNLNNDLHFRKEINQTLKRKKTDLFVVVEWEIDQTYCIFYNMEHYIVSEY